MRFFRRKQRPEESTQTVKLSDDERVWIEMQLADKIPIATVATEMCHDLSFGQKDDLRTNNNIIISNAAIEILPRSLVIASLHGFTVGMMICLVIMLVKNWRRNVRRLSKSSKRIGPQDIPSVEEVYSFDSSESSGELAKKEECTVDESFERVCDEPSVTSKTKNQNPQDDRKEEDHDSLDIQMISRQTTNILSSVNDLFKTWHREQKHSFQRMVKRELIVRDEQLLETLAHHSAEVQDIKTEFTKANKQQDEQLALLEHSTKAGLQDVAVPLESISKRLEETTNDTQTALVSHETRLSSLEDSHEHVSSQVASFQTSLFEECKEVEASALGRDKVLEDAIQALSLQVRTHEKRLGEEREKNAESTEALVKQAVGQLSSKVQHLERELENTREQSETRIGDQNQRLQAAEEHQDKVLLTLSKQLGNLETNLVQKQEKANAELARLDKESEERERITNSKFDSIEKELESCQREWGVVLQGFQKWDEKLASYKKSQEAVTNQLSLNLQGLEFDFAQTKRDNALQHEQVAAKALVATKGRKSLFSRKASTKAPKMAKLTTPKDSKVTQTSRSKNAKAQQPKVESFDPFEQCFDATMEC